MKDIQNLINAKFEEMVGSGAIEKVIEDKLTTCINEVFKSAFQSYGVLTKHFEKQVETSIEQGLFRLELEPYTDTINSFVKQKIAKHMEGEALKQISESIDQMFKPVPAETTMQSMIDLVQKAYKDDDYDNDRDEYLSMECEQSSHGWFDLKFWKQKSLSTGCSSRTNNPDIELHINKDGKIIWLNGGKTDYGSHNHNVESLFYRMAKKRTKITDIRSCDQDDFDNTYIGLGEDH